MGCTSRLHLCAACRETTRRLVLYDDGEDVTDDMAAEVLEWIEEQADAGEPPSQAYLRWIRDTYTKMLGTECASLMSPHAVDVTSCKTFSSQPSRRPLVRRGILQHELDKALVRPLTRT